MSKREIARVLRVSRLTVRKVLQSNSVSVPEIQRSEKAEPYRQQILDLLNSCKGNLVRVHEELEVGGAALLSLLLSFAEEAHLKRLDDLEVTNPQIDDLLDTADLPAGRDDQ